jgi:transposase
MSDLFGLDISLGSISSCEKRISSAIKKPVEQAHMHAQTEGVMYADETGWRECNKKAWLWVAVTTTVTVFLVNLSRGKKAAKKLIGGFKGLLGTDRWSPYRVHEGFRQFCWAHLLRRFVSFSEMKGKPGKIGKQLVANTKLMFHWHHRVCDGTLRRSTFKRRMNKLRIQVGDLLIEGEMCGISPMAGICKRLLAEEEHMWTFVDREEIEPTNNIAERALRKGVLWRKISFGTQSEAGSRFVERIMTVSATCKQQGRNAFDYLNEACLAALHERSAPSLLPSGVQNT